MDIHAFVCSNDVDHSPWPADTALIGKAQESVGVVFGPELIDYLTTYGYLGFESAELYGLNARQGLNSDMVKQTLYLVKYYPIIEGYIALENYGEGDYIVVDSEDQVFQFITEEMRLVPRGEKLYEYILARFEEECLRTRRKVE